MQQTFYHFKELEIILKGKNAFLVCDDAFDIFGIKLPCRFVRFSSFTPNPRYEDVKSGVDIFKKNNCNFIVAIGGGTSIDVAKCIKYHSLIDIPIIAIPTTSGTGSEATHFAVIYINGEKQSIADDKLLPEYVVLQPYMLRTLPPYQKNARC